MSKHPVEARRQQLVRKLTQVNRKIAAEQKRLAQIEARLAILAPVAKAA